MKKILLTVISALGILGATAAPELQLPAQVTEDFNRRLAEVPYPARLNLERVKTLSGDTLKAMEFLYAYLPLPDLTDKSFEYYLKNTEMALKVRNEMPWGKNIPDKEFLHFVLPARANNENLDSARVIFYNELKDRVKNLSMTDAILEANHWCHEKVSYQASDSRTSSPLSTVSQAIGRCGEESVFTVIALRSIGIPARQIYTPRWAHSDDNHAWVEAWADGQWHFLGACEPAPVLDLAWFNEPAARGMMMNTNVFGKYPGPEEIIVNTPITTIINVTSNYAPVGLSKIRVVDGEGKPVADAKVNFCIYNYAEFYPVASKRSDKDGMASLITGYGDIVVWATDGEKFGFGISNPSNNEVTDIVMTNPVGEAWEWEGAIIPPVKSGTLPVVPAELDKLCNERNILDDSIRNAYIATFATPQQAQTLAAELGVDADVLAHVLTQSRGNHGNIAALLRSLDADHRVIALDLLQAIKEKDRRDIDMEVVKDNIFYMSAYPDSALNNDYVVNPRIEREGLRPFKKYFQSRFTPSQLEAFRENPESIVRWVKDSITVYDNGWNPMNLRMSPASTLRNLATDSIGRRLFTVALARSAGVPAQIDPVTLEVKYLGNDRQWNIVKFDQEETAPVNTGTIYLDYVPTGRIEEPRYYTQFSLSRLRDGVPFQLEFDEGATVDMVNASQVPLEEGQYLLISGQRMADGSVLVRANSFTIIPDTVNHVDLKILQDTTQLQVIGNLEVENRYFDFESNAVKSLLQTAGRGFYVLGIIGGNDEPSTHVLNDISAMKDDLEKTGREIIVLYASQEERDKASVKQLPQLPSNLHMGMDIDGRIMKEIANSLSLANENLPLFVVADSFNRIIFVSQGYTIGLGNTLLDVLSKIK